MIEPLGVNPRGSGFEGVAAIMSRTGGTQPHVPHPATLDGLARSVRETLARDYPRAELTQTVAEYNARFGIEAMARSVAKLASGDAVVVATGQQPCLAGGPMYVLYKAVTAILLAREIERRLSVPAVPVFWNASEDHDIDEVSLAHAPSVNGVADLRVDLSAWRGMAVERIGPDERWRSEAARQLGSLAGVAGSGIEPREDEGWSAWFSRLLAETLGRFGLVIVEPRLLRPLCGEVFARAAGEWRDIQRLIRDSIAERARSEREPNFADLGGPPLFMDAEGFRRRLIEEDGCIRAKGTPVAMSDAELVRLARERPQGFSSHAALRPVAQNAILPVAAQVLGPGEIAYHEELYRFHASFVGAGRRMPVLWPRLSATVLDAATRSTMSRFGVSAGDALLPAEELVARFIPKGELADEIRRLARRSLDDLRALEGRILALDASMARPLAKTADTAGRAYETLAGKVEAAEAAAAGFAPDRLARLAEFVTPGGRPQERVFAWTVLTARHSGLADELLGGIDVFDHRHVAITLPEGGAGDER